MVRAVIERKDVFNAIDRERDYQDAKYPPNQFDQSLAKYLLVMEAELAEAKAAWLNGASTSEESLKEILQVVAVGVAAIEEHGLVERECFDL